MSDMTATDGRAIEVDRVSVRVRDGLQLQVTVHRPAGVRDDPRGVLCLPGLTRNARDFTVLARRLAADGFAVFALDARGRGGSDWDKDWRNYTVPHETQDVIDVIAALELARPAVIGTSRGGLVAMVLAALQPGSVGAVVLNDIGPVIEIAGLTRIAGYVGRLAVPPTWEEAARLLAVGNRKSFPAIPEADWGDVARQWFADVDGRPAMAYDPALARTVSVKDGAPPPLWPQFEALGDRPVLVIRGETSDILSSQTMTEMTRRLPHCRAITVAGEGHAPHLRDAPTIEEIGRFLASARSLDAHAVRAA